MLILIDCTQYSSSSSSALQEVGSLPVPLSLKTLLPEAMQTLPDICRLYAMVSEFIVLKEGG